MPALRVIPKTPNLEQSAQLSLTSPTEKKSEREGETQPNGVPSPETDPLRDRAVLLLSFCKLLLGTEGFLALFFFFGQYSTKASSRAGYAQA